MTPRPRAFLTVAMAALATLLPTSAAQAAPLRSLHQAVPWLDILYVLALLAALITATYLALKARSRRLIVWNAVACLAFFGFYVGGCVCPVGSVQNVTAALATPYVIPVTVLAIFALPLVFALLFGRVFCSSVCPLGAIQDLVLLKPLRVPLWLQYGLGFVPYVYLGVAVLFAATDSGYLICQYDPFVAMFRLDGPPVMFLWGGGLLLLAIFVGRPYCRFLCPYGALLGLCSRAARRHVTITPDKCINCRLCEQACPFGAIRPSTVEEGDNP